MTYEKGKRNIPAPRMTAGAIWLRMRECEAKSASSVRRVLFFQAWTHIPSGILNCPLFLRNWHPYPTQLAMKKLRVNEGRAE